METCPICKRPIDPIDIAYDEHQAYHDYCLEENYEPDPEDIEWEDED